MKGHHLWAHFTQIRSLSMRRSASAIARWNEAVRAAREVAERRVLPNGRRIRLENIHELSEGAVEDLALGARCPFLGQEAWVSADGRFDPCCAPDEQRRTLGELGNLQDTTMSAIWNGAAYQHLRATYMDHSLCRSCNMRQPVEDS